MIEYKFAILTEAVESVPEIRVGDTFLPIGMEVEPGGYECEAWLRLSDRAIFKTRIEHHHKFEWRTVTGETRAEITEKVREIERASRG